MFLKKKLGLPSLQSLIYRDGRKGKNRNVIPVWVIAFFILLLYDSNRNLPPSISATNFAKKLMQVSTDIDIKWIFLKVNPLVKRYRYLPTSLTPFRLGSNCLGLHKTSGTIVCSPGKCKVYGGKYRYLVKRSFTFGKLHFE